MAFFQQLTLWELLEEAADAPALVELESIWPHLDQALIGLPTEQQMAIAARVIVQLAEILESRAEQLLKDWKDSHNPDGPVISSDLFAGLVRMTVQLDLDDLKAPIEPQEFSPQNRTPPEPDDSIAEPVEKANVLAMVDDVITAEKLRKLAGEEDIQRWQQAIARYLQNVKARIRLIDLQQGLGMPMVEVWLGLLLGGFSLEQQGEFYDTQTIWVVFSDAP